MRLKDILKIHFGHWLPQADEPVGNEAEVEYKGHWTRWIALLLFCFSSICNAIVWITFSPVSNLAQAYFETSSLNINMMSIVFLIVYIPLVFPAAWFLDQKSYRLGMLVGVGLTLLGVWIRIIGKYGFAYAMIGQTLAAIGQPFILNAPPKMANNWFPQSQWTLATAIASVANPVGAGIGFIIPPSFALNSSLIPEMLLWEAVILTVPLSLCILFIKDRPPIPPSDSALNKRSENFFQSLKDLSKEIQFWILFAQFSLALGCFNTLATVINQLLIPYGYSNDDSGVIGLLTIVLGIVGCFVAGIIVDKTRKYKLALLISLIGGAASAAFLTLSLRPNNFALIALAGALLGIMFTPMMPISLELGCEVAFPIGEGTPSGILMAGGQIVGIITIVGIDFMLQKNLVKESAWLLTACMGAACVIAFFFNGKLKRLKSNTSSPVTLHMDPPEVTL